MSMTPERWHQIKVVLEDALELKPQQRSGFLAKTCADDPAMRQEVESLLALDDREASTAMLESLSSRVALPPGTNLGEYVVESLLGTGGMGEVYRARDPRLRREVAIKVLPPVVSNDPARLQRFEQEARAAAALNHPNILAVFQMGIHEGAPYLVSELLHGGTLREQLRRGPVPVRKAIDYSVQIARGLAAAHENGVVHRDLKPENLFITNDGRAKILDFGLAKLTQRLWEETATGKEGTESGMVMGTVGYMSPEQVSGKPADPRADIFALGAIIYEALSGKRAFHKPTAVETMNAIVNEDLTASQFPPTIPPALQRVVHRCLDKNPAQRFQSASDLAFALEALSDSIAMELKWIAEGTSQTGVLATPRSQRSRQWFRWGVAAAVAATALAGLLAYQRLTTSPAPVVVADIVPPKGTQFSFLVNGPPAISPDGQALAFSAQDKTGHSHLWVRSLDGSTPQLIPGTEDGAAPFWSPDSKRIGFFEHRKLTILELQSGSSVTLADDATGSAGGTWNPAGTVLFIRGDGIHQVPASGGSPALVLPRDASRYAFLFHPAFLPDGKHFLYLAANSSSSDVFFASLDGKENRLLLQGSSQAIYGSGFLLYVRGSNLVAQPFDPVGGKLGGSPHRIAQQVQQTAFLAMFSASQNGTLTYEPATRAPTVTQLFWFDRSGKRLGLIGVPAIHYDLRLSPDARRLASSAGGPKSEMWVDDLDRSVRMRLTFDPDSDHGIPVWSPDGRTLLFSTMHGSKAGVGIFRKASNGAGSEELLLASDRPDREVWATDWSRDGRFLLLMKGDMSNPSAEADIWVLPLTGDRKPVLFLRAATGALDATFSPDGRWVAYTSIESGNRDIYVASFDASKFLSSSSADTGPAGKWQISNNGGWNPRWRRDGKELFYLGQDNTIFAVETEGRGDSFELGRTQRLFTAPLNPFASTFDVAPDGQRFVMSAAPDEEEAPLVLMSNWPTRLQEK